MMAMPGIIYYIFFVVINFTFIHIFRTPSEFFNYLRVVTYQRRNKGNPLWNQLLVGGYNNGSPFLGYVDLIGKVISNIHTILLYYSFFKFILGTCYEENFIATGFGAYLAIPLIREKWNPRMSEGEARQLLEDCLRVLFYRYRLFLI